MVLDQRAKVRSQDVEEVRVKTRDKPDREAVAEAAVVDRAGVKAAVKDRAAGAAKDAARVEAEVRADGRIAFFDIQLILWQADPGIREPNQNRKGGVTMPRGDRTGPMGMGPMTGRAAGFCAGFGMPGYAGFGPGRGYWGRGRGRGMAGGRGWRHRFYATGLPGWQRFGAWGPMYAAAPNADTETDMLRNQAEFFRSQLAEIEKRLGELEQRQGS